MFDAFSRQEMIQDLAARNKKSGQNRLAASHFDLEEKNFNAFGVLKISLRDKTYFSAGKLDRNYVRLIDHEWNRLFLFDLFGFFSV